jgi:GTP cyclohydrolase II
MTAQFERFGVRVGERATTGVHVTDANVLYLAAKVDHTGHMLALSKID